MRYGEMTNSERFEYVKAKYSKPKEKKKRIKDMSLPEKQGYVRWLFDYRDDGQLIRRVARNGARGGFGSVAGGVGRKGYSWVGVDSSAYQSHRIVWLWHNGYLPELEIDHINRDRSDNRIENLREVSRLCNSRNTRKKDSNKSGVTGVHWDKERRKWKATIRLGGASKTIGSFIDFNDAVVARWRAEVAAGWPGCNKDTCAYRYLHTDKGCATDGTGVNQINGSSLEGAI
jgi:hypothetical protein